MSFCVYVPCFWESYSYHLYEGISFSSWVLLLWSQEEEKGSEKIRKGDCSGWNGLLKSKAIFCLQKLSAELLFQVSTWNRLHMAHALPFLYQFHWNSDKVDLTVSLPSQRSCPEYARKREREDENNEDLEFCLAPACDVFVTQGRLPPFHTLSCLPRRMRWVILSVFADEPREM